MKSKDEIRHSKLYQELSDEMLKPVVGGLDQSANSKKDNKETKPAGSSANEFDSYEDKKGFIYTPGGSYFSKYASFDGDWQDDFS